MRMIIILILFVLIVGTLGVFTVSPREYALVSNHWHKEQMYTTGVHFAFPGIDTVKYVYMNERSSVLTIPKTITVDGQANVKTEVLINWHVVKPLLYLNSLQKLEMVGFNKELVKNILDAIQNNHQASDLLFLNQSGSLLNAPLIINQLGIVIDKVAINNLIVVSLPIAKNIESQQVAPNILTVSNSLQIESAYYKAQAIKTQTEILQAKMYQQIQQQNPKFYDYFRKVEIYKNTAKSKADIPSLQQLYGK